jgi:hypothetical protein
MEFLERERRTKFLFPFGYKSRDPELDSDSYSFKIVGSGSALRPMRIRNTSFRDIFVGEE